MPELDEFSFLPAQAAALGRPMPPVKRVRLTIADGRSLSGLRWGDAPPRVTLLHGAGLNAHTWDTTLLHLGEPALALDLAGHGDSSWRDDAAYVARVLAPDVVTALQTWTDGPQTLVGHSLGGLTAAAVAASRADLVAGGRCRGHTPPVVPAGRPPRKPGVFAVPPSPCAPREVCVDHLACRAAGFSD